MFAPDRPRPDCVICGSAQVTERLRSGDYTILRCKECGMQFADPVPDSDTLDEAYNTAYSVNLENYVSGRVGDEKLDRLERLLPERGRLLEVGASYGAWLGAARERGWDVAGVEIAAAAAQYGREQLHLDIVTGHVFDAPGAEGSYDAVVMWHVLEHTPDPAAVVARVAWLLRPGGVFALHVPNGASFGNRIGGNWWHWMHPPIHLWYFTPPAMRILLTRNGFEQPDIAVVRGDGYDPLMNMAVAGAGRVANAARRVAPRRGERPEPVGAFVGGGSGQRAFELAQRVTGAISRVADGPVRRFESRGHGDELAVYTRRAGGHGSRC